MATIGQIWVQIAANAKPFLQAMELVDRKLRYVADRIKTFTAWGTERLEAFFKNPARVFTETIGKLGDWISRIPMVGGLLAIPFELANAAGTALLDTVDKNADAILELGRAAKRANVSAQDLQVVAFMFGNMGDDIKGAELAVMHFNRELGKAVRTGALGRNIFNRLGFEVRELLQRPFIERVGLVLERIKSMGSPALQAAAIAGAFGRYGRGIMFRALEGAQGIADIQERLARFGLIQDDALVASVQRVRKATNEIKLAWQGLGNQLVTAIAPFMAEIADQLGTLPIGFGGLADVIQEGMAQAIRFVAGFIDAFENGRFFDEAKMRANQFFAIILKGLADVIDALPSLESQVATTWGNIVGRIAGEEAGAIASVGAIGIIGGLRPTMTAGLRVLQEEFERAGQARRGRGPVRMLGHMFELETTAARDAAEELINRVQTRMGRPAAPEDPFARINTGVERLEEISRRIISPWDKFTAQMEDLEDAVDRVNEGLALMEFAGAEALGMTDDIFEGMQEHLNELLVVGQRQAGELFATLQGAFGETKFAAVMEKGTGAAASAILQAETQARRTDVQQEMRRLLDMQLHVNQNQERTGVEALSVLRQINRATGGEEV